MREANSGDKVKIEVVMSAGGEVVFDSRSYGQPLSFTVGNGEVAPVLEDVVMGMKPGELKHSTVEQAFGPYREDLIWTVDRDRVAPQAHRVGAEVQVRLSQPQELAPAVVREVEDGTVTLDANHPLAGKLVDYDVRLLEIS